MRPCCNPCVAVAPAAGGRCTRHAETETAWPAMTFDCHFLSTTDVVSVVPLRRPNHHRPTPSTILRPFCSLPSLVKAKMASVMCTKRLQKELKSLHKSPLTNPRIIALPNESNILEWHYLLEGAKDTPYEGGKYWGKLLFPKEYPLKPPGVMMMTPSGRFRTNRRLCLSMSDFHPGETFVLNGMILPRAVLAILPRFSENLAIHIVP